MIKMIQMEHQAQTCEYCKGSVAYDNMQHHAAIHLIISTERIFV